MTENNETCVHTYTDAIGKKITGVSCLEYGSSHVIIELEGGEIEMRHYQDCCETVQVEDVDGDPSDVIGGVIHAFEKVTEDFKQNDWGIYEWTLYRLITSKGDLTIRWVGSSNGYYSVDVDVDINLTNDN